MKNGYVFLRTRVKRVGECEEKQLFRFGGNLLISPSCELVWSWLDAVALFIFFGWIFGLIGFSLVWVQPKMSSCDFACKTPINCIFSANPRINECFVYKLEIFVFYTNSPRSRASPTSFSWSTISSAVCTHFAETKIAAKTNKRASSSSSAQFFKSNVCNCLGIYLFCPVHLNSRVPHIV